MSDLIISCQNSTIQSGATVELEAKSTIMLDVGFTIKLGGEFAAEISGVEYCVSDLLESETAGGNDD